MTTIGSQYRGTSKYSAVYNALLEAAKSRHLLHYVEVADLIGVPRAGHHMARQVGQVLGEISEDEHNAGHPMLSAIAVSEADFPGDGFFKLARRLGRLSEYDSQAERAFLQSEQQSVYDLWSK